jgi:hypothetical protein
MEILDGCLLDKVAGGEPHGKSTSGPQNDGYDIKNSWAWSFPDKPKEVIVVVKYTTGEIYYHPDGPRRTQDRS